MKRSAQIITFLKAKIDLWFNAIRARWNKTKIQFSWVESRFSELQSAKLNTNESILMAGTEYFGETAQPRDHIPVNTMRKSHSRDL